ncbi:MAG: CDP-alcohol phosphatidyltransferase family protein [Oscillospiraceae bacterium]|nr:CDP-alcohol phosphatidyltransferase family protein [Oscillospiraceae bacterium]
MKKQIANIITLCRMIGSIGLLFCPVFSACFYGLYLFCGLTDMVDGAIARKTGSAGTFGARLDTVADFLFVAVSFGKLLTVIRIPVWIWVWTAIIAVVKLVSLICGFRRRKKIPSLHTMMNKVSGFCLFLLPLTTALVALRYTAPVVCAVATVAAVQEGCYIATDRDVV